MSMNTWIVFGVLAVSLAGATFCACMCFLNRIRWLREFDRHCMFAGHDDFLVSGHEASGSSTCT
jgi:hypothetical protein